MSDRVALTHAAGPVLVFFTPLSHRATRLSVPTVASCDADTWWGSRGSPIEKLTLRCLAAFSQSTDNSDMEHVWILVLYMQDKSLLHDR